MYPQSTTPAAPALPPDPPSLMTSSSTESVSATVPPDMVRSHVASMNAESTQMTLLAMCTPAQIAHLWATSMVPQDYHAIILKTACIYMRPSFKSVSVPQTRRSSRRISSSFWPLFFASTLKSQKGGSFVKFWKKTCFARRKNRNMALRSAFVFASNQKVHRPRFQSPLHFDVRNIQQIRSEKQFPSAWRLLSAALLERWPQVCRRSAASRSRLRNYR